jgi:hypothetical protein
MTEVWRTEGAEEEFNGSEKKDSSLTTTRQSESAERTFNRTAFWQRRLGLG